MLSSNPMLTKTKKTKTIADHQVHTKDTGSPEVQIALLSKKIEQLASHLTKNKNDLHSRRGLLSMVADRQRHMNFLQKKSVERFNEVMKKLNLKKRA
jgi:small subunit ribosomal protein S15